MVPDAKKVAPAAKLFAGNGVGIQVQVGRTAASQWSQAKKLLRRRGTEHSKMTGSLPGAVIPPQTPRGLKPTLDRAGPAGRPDGAVTHPSRGNQFGERCVCNLTLAQSAPMKTISCTGRRRQERDAPLQACRYRTQRQAHWMSPGTVIRVGDRPGPPSRLGPIHWVEPARSFQTCAGRGLGPQRGADFARG